MNEARRKIIAASLSKIEDAINALTEVRDEEQDSFDNMPEGLQQGEKGEAMESAIEALSSAVDNLESAKGDLEGIE